MSFIAWWYGLSGESSNLGLKSIIVGIVDRVDVLNKLFDNFWKTLHLGI